MDCLTDCASAWKTPAPTSDHRASTPDTYRPKQYPYESHCAGQRRLNQCLLVSNKLL